VGGGGLVGDLSPLFASEVQVCIFLIILGSNAGNPGLKVAQTHCGGTSSPEKVALK
jgi:hypothetical protein